MVTNNETQKYMPQITLVNMLQVLFIGLKLTEQIDWSWWLVLLPVLIEAGLIVLTYSVAGIAIFFAKRAKRRLEEAEREAAWNKLTNHK